MTLRKKSVIIIIAISLLIISLVNASARFILLRSFSNLEEEYCIKNIPITFNAIASDGNRNEYRDKPLKVALRDKHG